jgi:hypothetical protein
MSYTVSIGYENGYVLWHFLVSSFKFQVRLT